MTVSTPICRADYQGNGITTTFPVPFRILSPANLGIYQLKNGVETKITSGYTVMGPDGQGSVVFDTPPAADVALTFLREVPYTQEMDLNNAGSFNADVLEGGADALELQIQQIKEALARTFINSITTRPPYPSMTDYLNQVLNAVTAAINAQNAAQLAASFALTSKDEAFQYKNDAEAFAQEAYQIAQDLLQYCGLGPAERDVFGLIKGGDPATTYIDVIGGVPSVSIPNFPQSAIGMRGLIEVAPTTDTISTDKAVTPASMQTAFLDNVYLAGANTPPVRSHTVPTSTNKLAMPYDGYAIALLVANVNTSDSRLMVGDMFVGSVNWNLQDGTIKTHVATPLLKKDTLVWVLGAAMGFWTFPTNKGA